MAREKSRAASRQEVGGSGGTESPGPSGGGVPQAQAGEERPTLFQPKKLYRTEEVLRATGLSRQVLYRYITLGLITPAEVTETGRRLFGEDVFSRLELIQALNRSGYTLRDIRETFFRRR